jgi:outer membrane protein assembly factor BamB
MISEQVNRRKFSGRVFLLLAVAVLWAGAAPSQVIVWTAQYENDRTGANVQETILNTSNVNSQQFGLLFTRPVDGLIYAQPLYVPGVQLGTSTYNVVYVATLNNSVYAFDADNAANAAPLWHVNLGPALQIPAGGAFLGTEIGIVGTPVIDVTWNALYVVALTVQKGDMQYNLHALNLTNGQEQFNGPVVIQGHVPGTAFDARNGILAFTPNNVLQRPALTLYGGNVFVAFGALAEKYLYHGWLFSYNAHTLQQAGIYCSTPNGSKGGIWMSGHGMAADVSGLYLMVGNGTTNKGDLSSSFVRLNGTTPQYFTPANYASLNKYDWDLNAGGPLLLPNTTLLLGGGKTGAFFLLDRNNLGGLVAGDTQVVQTWQATTGCGTTAGEDCDELHDYIYWYAAPGQPLLYVWPMNEHLKAYAFNGSTFNTTPVVKNNPVAGFPGGQLTVSSNGGKDGTGIVWAAMSTQDAYGGPVPGMLRAFDAITLAELWNSDMNAADNAGLLSKFTPPIVANGKVYLATFSKQLNVYGLR